MSEPAHVLVVAHQTAATPALLDAVRERARSGPATFHLVVPRQAHGMHKVVDPQDAGDEEAQEVLAAALPKLGEAAGRTVTGSLGDAEPMSRDPGRRQPRRLRRDHHLDAAAAPVALAEARPGLQDPRARAAGHPRGGGQPAPRRLARRVGSPSAGASCRRRRYRLLPGEARDLPGARPPRAAVRAGQRRPGDRVRRARRRRRGAGRRSRARRDAGRVAAVRGDAAGAGPAAGDDLRDRSQLRRPHRRDRRHAARGADGVRQGRAARWRRPADRSAAPRSSAGSTTRASWRS